MKITFEMKREPFVIGIKDIRSRNTYWGIKTFLASWLMAGIEKKHQQMASEMLEMTRKHDRLKESLEHIEWRIVRSIRAMNDGKVEDIPAVIHARN